MFHFFRKDKAVVRDLLADTTANPGDHNSFAYHPVQYQVQPLNNPGGVRNLSYANLSLPRSSCIGEGVMVDRMMRPMQGAMMQGGKAVITSTYGRQVTGFTAAPLYDRDSGVMAYDVGEGGANPHPFGNSGGIY